MREWIAAGIGDAVTPRVTLKGREEAAVEGHSGLFSYETDCVRVRTAMGILRIEGEALTIGYLGTEDLLVRGRVDRITVEGE